MVSQIKLTGGNYEETMRLDARSIYVYRLCINDICNSISVIKSEEGKKMNQTGYEFELIGYDEIVFTSLLEDGFMPIEEED